MTAPTHFKLSLTVAKPSMASGPVEAIQPGILVQPDPLAVRACLPHYYRAAFDRDGTFWQDKSDPDGPQYCELRDSHGNRMNIIWARPIIL
jgi:hypothetical protein